MEVFLQIVVFEILIKFRKNFSETENFVIFVIFFFYFLQNLIKTDKSYVEFCKELKSVKHILLGFIVFEIINKI